MQSGTRDNYVKTKRRAYTLNFVARGFQ